MKGSDDAQRYKEVFEDMSIAGGDNTFVQFSLYFKDCIFGTKNGLKYDDHTCIALCDQFVLQWRKKMYVLVIAIRDAQRV